MGTISKSYIQAVRERLRLSQKEFADEVGTTDRTVSRWETGDSLPRKMSMIRKIREMGAGCGIAEGALENAEADKENRKLKARLSQLEKKEQKSKKKISDSGEAVS